MSIPLECLTDIIGLSETTCNCFDDNKPNNANESPSGLFVDSPELSLKALSGSVEDCSEDLWSLMVKARTEATRQAQLDLLTGIRNRNDVRVRYQPCYSSIGEDAMAATESLVNSTYYGMKIRPLEFQGLTMKFKSIVVFASAADTIDFEVYSNSGNENTGEFNATPLFSQTGIAVTQGRNVIALDSEVELNLYDEDCDNLEFLALLKFDTAKPMRNRTSCGCGGKKECHKKMMVITGVTTDDPENGAQSYSYAGGLSIQSSIVCSYNELICDGNMDFANDPMAMSIAYLILYKSRELLMYWISQSESFDAYTLLNKESCYGKIKNNLKKYNEYKAAIVAEIDPSETDCLICANQGIAKRTIFA